MLKQKLFLSIVFLAIVFSLVGCYSDVMVNHQLSLINKSEKSISILYSNGAETPITQNNVAFYITDRQVVQPDSTIDITILGNNNPWHQYIEEGKAKTLSLYVFEADTLKKYNNIYSMDDLVNQQKYLKLLTYSEIELQKTNWKLNFNN